jgi:hypothetical protein
MGKLRTGTQNDREYGRAVAGLQVYEGEMPHYIAFGGIASPLS